MREIVKIDEEKCDGCGLCVPACAEGAIQIIDGKARLVDDKYCDGLGACLGECPRDAITMEEREADDFDEAAVEEHLAGTGAARGVVNAESGGTRAEARAQSAEEIACGCPGAATMDMRAERKAGAAGGGRLVSELGQWPVKIELVNPRAPYFEDADLMVIADCSPLAYANTHPDLVKDHAIAIGCPKFGDVEFYIKKLSAIVANNNVHTVAVARMEVPCCGGLTRAVVDAVKASGKNVPVEEIVVGIGGEILNRQWL
ncbi:MAG: 4Fe-4S binding protein [Candidatus Coatesbacteria bacterium]|nr:MAG: 4Fe-4S binding protein [Candidatus Coatesbacteria bacterium]